MSIIETASVGTFNSSDGEVIVRTNDGVAVSILIGNLAENATGGSLTLKRYVMLYAFADEAIFPEPEKPKPNDDPEQANQDEKEYLRKVADRNKSIEKARLRARELNQSYADWIYIVPEDIVNGLRPDLKATAAVSVENDNSAGDAKPPEDAAEPTEKSTESSKQATESSKQATAPPEKAKGASDDNADASDDNADASGKNKEAAGEDNEAAGEGNGAAGEGNGAAGEDNAAGANNDAAGEVAEAEGDPADSRK